MSTKKSYNIFIDTEIFCRLNFNFAHEDFKKLLEYIKEGEINLFIPKTTILECKNKISTTTKNLHSTLTTAIRKLKNYNAASDYLLQIPSNDKENSIEKKQNDFDKFIRKTKAKIIQSDKVDIDRIMDLYINNSAPFGKEGKKNEFPDAIAFSALESEVNDAQLESLYIISHDKDWATINKINSKFHHKEDLSDLFDEINQYNLEYYKNAQDMFQQWKKDNWLKHKTELKSQIQENLNNASFDEHDSILIQWNPRLDDIEIRNEKFIIVEEERIKVNVRLYCPYIYELKFLMNTSSGQEEKSINAPRELHLHSSITISKASNGELVTENINIQEQRFSIAEFNLLY